LDGPVETFSAAPALRRPACATNRLAAGGAALAFDPVCGDGTAQAMRGGLLAAATAAAIRDGLGESTACAYYEARLAHSFATHLAACARAYDPAIFGPTWNDEIVAIRAAAAAHRAAPALAFGLEELQLVALATAT
jgi:flavin-dependent dehydrogenase